MDGQGQVGSAEEQHRIVWDNGGHDTWLCLPDETWEVADDHDGVKVKGEVPKGRKCKGSSDSPPSEDPSGAHPAMRGLSTSKFDTCRGSDR